MRDDDTTLREPGGAPPPAAGARDPDPVPPVLDVVANAMLAAIVTSSDDAIVSKDLDGIIRTWNAGAERIFGWRADEVQGRPITILLPPERLHEEKEILATLRRGGSIDHFETTRVTKDGRRIRVSVSVSPIRDPGGAIVGAAKIARDITPQRELAALRARLSAIVESSADAIVGKDLSGTITDWNAAAERLFGYTAADIVGKSIMSIIPPERREEEAHILATLRAGRRIEHFETQRMHKDGTRLDISVSLSPIRDETGRIVGAAKIARDVGARKQLEREREDLLRKEREARTVAEEASRAKDAFLAVVSHELRTPLSPILTWARLLRQHALDPAQQQHALETIERNARTQAQLVADLLDISRIVAGQLRLEVRPVDLRDVIRLAIEVVRPAADAKQIRIQSTLDTETGLIHGDPDRMQQVMWNLLTNAIKFTPKGGRVQVTLERVNSHVEIAVSDTGCGVSPEFLPRMFERFQQADATTSRTHGGLGLGLAIVRHITEQHGGTVCAESPGEGHGATFTVKLPRMIFERAAGELERRHPTRPARTSSDFERVQLTGLRVLVVDDEPDSNDVVGTVLSTCGAEVRSAASAEAGLAELQRWAPHVLISDIGMPVVDGYALLGRVRALSSDLAFTPAIALTAYAATEDRVRIFSSGFQIHLVKPIDPAELVAAVANLGRMRVARPD